MLKTRILLLIDTKHVLLYLEAISFKWGFASVEDHEYSFACHRMQRLIRSLKQSFSLYLVYCCFD
jgi:hypothetical protein